MAGHSARTAIHRTKASAPLRWLLGHDYLSPEGGAVLDYGCGRGADVDRLRADGFTACGWDPNHRDDVGALRGRYPVVLSTFVANVLNPSERAHFYHSLRAVLERGGEAFVSVRRDVPEGDGYFTSTGTYQAWVDVSKELEGTGLTAECIREVSGYATYRLTEEVAR